MLAHGSTGPARRPVVPAVEIFRRRRRRRVVTTGHPVSVPVVGRRYARAMTDIAAEPSGREIPFYERHQNLILVVAGAIMFLVVAGLIYHFATAGGGSKVMAQIKVDVQGQLRTTDVSSRKLGFAVPSLTKQTIYACDAKNVAEPN